MSFAVTALAPRLNAEVFAKIPDLAGPKFPPPPPPDPTKLATKNVGLQLTGSLGSLRQLADGWCGTVPKHFPIPVPKGGSDDGDWCGTVPRPHFPVPPTPPQPWLDLANAAQSFR